MPKFKVKGTYFHNGKTYEGTTAKPGEIDLPSNKFFITSSRFIDGQYVFADPLNPAEVTLQEGAFIDSGLKAEEPETPKSHHAGHRTAGAPSAAEHFAKQPEAKPSKSGRAADKDAL